LQSFFNTSYYGNTVLEYSIAIGIVFISLFAIQIIKIVVIKKLLASAENGLGGRGDFIIKSVKRFLIPILYLGALYLAINSLNFPEGVSKVLQAIYLVLAALFLIRFVITISNFMLMKFIEKTKEEEDARKIKPLLSVLNFAIWVIGLLFLLDNLGFQISTVVAGLGVGGIAVALAAQAVLGDLFSYFVIFFDKPFEIGDFIIFDDKVGAIEKIGIKSTRVRSLSGEQLIISNSNLTNARVHNYKRMEKRRVVFSLGVTYQTKPEQLRAIPTIIKEIIEANELVTFDRSHFKNYGDFSLNFESVYFVNSADYLEFMNVQQEINLNIYEEFAKREIEFAYPTRTLFINKTDV